MDGITPSNLSICPLSSKADITIDGENAAAIAEGNLLNAAMIAFLL